VEPQVVGEVAHARAHAAPLVDHLRDAHDAAGTCAETGDLDDQVDRRLDLVAHRRQRQRDVAHEDHGLEAAERVGRRVGVTGRQRPLVARVHGLQHVERLRAARLADDDPIRAHAQRVAHEGPQRHRTEAVGVGRPRFEAHDVPGGQPQLGGIFDRHDPLAVGDQRGERVEQRRLARARPAADDDVGTCRDCPREQLRHGGRAVGAHRHGTGTDAAFGEARPVAGAGPHGRVDARAVGMARVDERARAIVAQPERGDVALEQVHDRRQVEHDVGLDERTGALDPHRSGAVDHDLRHGIVGEQRLEGAEPEQAVKHVDASPGARRRRKGGRRAATPSSTAHRTLRTGCDGEQGVRGVRADL
jgi:hypothetical protein